MSDDRPTGADRWGLLASSIAGQPLDVRHADGDRAWTDGLTVHVPRSDDDRRTALEVVVQAGLIRRGSFSPAILRPLRGRSAATDRYLAHEGWAVAAALRAELPGLLRSLGPQVHPSSPSPASSLAAALSREPAPEGSDAFGTVRTAQLLATADALDATDGGSVVFPGKTKNAPIDELDDDAESDDLGTIMRLLSSPIGIDTPLSRLFARLLGLGRRPSAGEPGGELATGTTRASSRRRGVISHRASFEATTPTPAASGALSYPEWDVDLSRHRPQWCTVQELTPAPAGAQWPASDVEIERAISGIGLSRRRVRRQPQGHDLDLDAAVEAVVDARSGAGPRSDLYVDNLLTQRDLGVLVLLDVSGSTAEAAGVRSVHEAQVVAAGALLREFHDVGARTAFYAFRSRGREHVQLLRLKAFDERCSSIVWRRAASIEPAAYTRLGAAIRHSTHLLAEETGTTNRLLVVLTDGFTYDHGYEGRYGEADARHALKEARARGIGCVCLSLGGGDERSLRRVFGTASYAAAMDHRDLRARLPGLCRSALRTAQIGYRRALAADGRTAGASARVASP